MKQSIKKIILLLAITSFGLACKNEKAMEKTPGIDLANMDTNESPNNDFFKYVNGSWLDRTEIPADKTSWGSFNELRKKTDDDVHSILSEAIKQGDFPKIKDAKGREIDSDQEKAVNYYKTIMDTVARNKAGIAPIKPILAQVDAIKKRSDIEKVLINFAPYGGAGFFGFGVSNDMKNSSMNAGYISPSRLGLSQDYYLDQDKDTKEKLNKYQDFVASMLTSFGDSDAAAKKNAAIIVAFEHSLAVPRLTKEESRDDRKLYNPTTISELTKMVPAINWRTYFKGLGIEKIDTVIVSQPAYMKAMNHILKTASINDIKLYLRWNAINRYASKLTTDLETKSWEFYGKVMSGAQQQRPRDERALSSLNGAIGEALGKLYVAKKFPPEAKAKAEEMIKNVRLGFEVRINSLDWMSDATKKKAIEKLHQLTVKIAYPDKWKDYSALQIDGPKDGSYFGNVLHLSNWRFQENMDKLGKPVDRTEWGMNPQTVNAYFNPVNNEIVFPAAILQPPFYNYKADEAVNYGGMGAVIGHEISHSFDDQGSRFDGEGNLKNWWTKEDLEKFTALGKKFGKQYSDIVAIGDTHLNGDFTLGENIGDLGGLQASFAGLQIFYKTHKKPGKIDGFTPEQRFFLSWGTVWRTKMRDDALRSLIKTNPHSPGMYRAYVPLKNIDAFYQAFDIKKGDSMYLSPEERVKLW